MAEAVDNWDELAPWWREEAATDLVYREDIGPMLRRLTPDDAAAVIDLGCGEGQWLRWLSTRGLQAFGCDRSLQLLTDAAGSAPVVCAELPDLSWLRSGSVDTALSVFVLDLIADVDEFFAETMRVVRPGGSLVVVINHPGFTAPGSGPLIDLDGEVLWRWGSYLEDGSSSQPAGDRSVVFHHRSIARLLTAAGAAGWALQAVEEQPLGAAAIDREPTYAGQEGIPRFFGARWER
ncbi:MAG: class I SAM-dependent methyltransferase [Acidimicrobiia bacterium]|nr:MAG: class I SAM-dependent methyltransferase [Acidimicrobiia bacterium]